jgi:hypothetical protein
MNEMFRYGFQSPDVTYPRELNYMSDELNQHFNTLNNFLWCHKRYIKHFKTSNEFKKELESPDIDMVCKRELEEFRKANNDGLTYKEVVGVVKVSIPADMMINKPF